MLNNSEWLEFALEHGIITLEQAQYSEKGSAVYKNMGTYDWTSIIYSNASDIVSVEDEAAIARAEVEYENAVREIENEDKKIDQDLKKLDTEHSALQTEYDSIKSVIDKNVESIVTIMRLRRRAYSSSQRQERIAPFPLIPLPREGKELQYQLPG